MNFDVLSVDDDSFATSIPACCDHDLQNLTRSSIAASGIFFFFSLLWAEVQSTAVPQCWDHVTIQ